LAKGSTPSSVSTSRVGAGVGVDWSHPNRHPTQPPLSSSSRARSAAITLDTITSLRGGGNHFRNKRRNILSMVAHIIGTGDMTSTTVRGDGGGSGAGSFEGVELKLSPPSAPMSSLTSVLSKSSSIILSTIATFINIASGAFVSSGYFGACIATWILRNIHQNILPNMVTIMAAKNNIVDGGGANSIESSSNVMHVLLHPFDGKYRWASMASLLSVLLQILTPFSSNNQSNIADGFVDNISFMVHLWIYSHTIDPLLGGAIGLAHVALGGMSMILGNHRLRTTMYRLGGEWRLKKLNQYNVVDGVGEDDVYIDPLKAVRPVRLPVLMSTSGTIVTAIANGMGSASLLLVSPQYFLELYMFWSSIISWWSNNRQSSDGYFFGRLVRWLSERGIASCPSNTNDATTIVGGCGLGGIVDSPWTLATRLVAFYWITILSKTLLTFIAICRNDATRRMW
jgi:hypothetical protein